MDKYISYENLVQYDQKVNNITDEIGAIHLNLDKILSNCNTIDSTTVKLSGIQTITGTKYFSASPVLINNVPLRANNSSGVGLDLINLTAANTIVIGHENLPAESAISLKRTIRPSPSIGAATGVDLGTSSNLFRNLYLSGNLSDGTNSISIANIVDKSTVTANPSGTGTNLTTIGINGTIYSIPTVDPNLNIKNGDINGSLTQTNLSYDQMILDFEPNMVAYVSYIGAGVSLPTSEQLIALLNSDKTNPYVAAILGQYTFEQYCQGFLAGTGSIQPGVSNKTAIDALVAQQLTDRWGVSSSDDLTNTFGIAADGAFAAGFKNKVYSPAAFTLGFDNQAGDEGYPSESIGAIAIGYRVKSLGNQASIIGKQSVFTVSDYSGEELEAAKKYRQNRLSAKTYLQSIGSDAVSLFPEDSSTDTLFSGTAKGENSHVLGGSIAIGESAVVLNDNNIAIGDNSQVAGNQNISLAPDGLTTGLQNYVYQGAIAAITGGSFNVNTGRSSIVAGEGNLNRGIGSIVSGYQCEENGSDAIMQGIGLFSNKDYSAIFGKYNKVNRIISYKTTYQTELPGSCVLLKVPTGTHYLGSIDVALRVTFKTLPDKGGFNVVGAANPLLAPVYLTWSNSFVDNVFTPATFQTILNGNNYTWLGLSTRNKSNITYEISKFEVNINNEGWQEVVLQDPMAYQSTVSVDVSINHLFAIGNGTADNARSNAFEITDDNRAKVYGAPVDPVDVVRKYELDTKVDGGTLSQSFFDDLY